MNALCSSHEDGAFMVRRGRLGKLTTNGLSFYRRLPKSTNFQVIDLVDKKLLLESL